MSYINFKGTVKKINLKSSEETEITISIPASELDGQYNTLQSMLELKVIGGLDSQIVTYKVLKNARTGKPITKYTVDDVGVVSVAKPEGEQLSMDLGLPPEKVEVKADPEQIDLEVIQDFILSGLAPCFDDMQYDFLEITERLAGGDTYLKIAADIGMGVGVFVVMVDEYRKRVAPMAAKWDEWRKGQVNTVPPKDGEPLNSQQEEQQNGDQPEEQEGANTDSSEQTEENESEDNNKPEDDSNPATDTDSETTVDKEELEEYILKVRPNFDDIPVDFPTLLQQRREEGKTWMQIAKSIGLTSGQITTKWTAYKKMVAKQMRNGGAA
jgi:DNA-directed RNA polymerase specialized sigma24 family protein